jgi:UDP-3-O-[3-hydroxymyristoyl] N-acetylglucosamine deacetylase
VKILNSAVRPVVSGGLVRQKTLKYDINCEGIALHSGLPVKMRLSAAAADSGIWFHRTDVDFVQADIPASYDHVVDTRLCTTIANEHGVKVSTIEHLMAALAGLEIDNAIIELDAEEVPIMDGSSAPFIAMIEKAGIVEQNLPRKAIRVLRTVSVRDGLKFLKVEPSKIPVVNLEINFECDQIGRQALSLPMTKDAFVEDISDARTFGFLHEVEELRQMGLVRGGSLENAVVLSEGKVLNEEGLRHKDEFVRHKILDCIGDLYLAGAPVIGAVSGSCSGHALNNALLRMLLADETAWVWETVETKEIAGPADWDVEPARVLA